MNSSRPSLEQIFETHIQTLCLSLRPNTVAEYRYIGRRFFAYLRTAFPEVHRLSQLRRDPHLLSWFRWLSEQQPPLSNTTRFHYLIRLRRLLHSLPANHSIQPDFIRREDFPVQPRYLPRPLSLQEDQLLQQELRRTDNLVANALRLMRATGIRIGECLDLSLDCLRQLEPDRWALHVPLGKLHTERLVPADPELRQIVERILALRASAPPSYLAKSQPLLLPRSRRQTLDKTLRSVLAQTAKRAGCFSHVTPHRLRHSFATEMLRLGVSLPALMQLLGHKDIRMTLRYVEVTQQDLQREFHQARQNAGHSQRLPALAFPKDISSAGLPAICQALESTRHLLEMYRRQLGDENGRRTLRRLDKRLRAVASQLQRIHTEEECRKNGDGLAS
jgi:site-specific recombinase XerD